ncbi:hypothetical protein CLV56_1040 [Mumia flava]|uniref:DUF6801 domain-containing protein n=1 Tax=Mumia flava TaxID=1348852 RepID=A0A0B2BL22_9ACTN|nr:DUF6801 domain-containing protein [Mumia flava]PJJ56827.1 hypothetical protein CLV56_1040 [Mumia flava]
MSDQQNPRLGRRQLSLAASGALIAGTALSAAVLGSGPAQAADLNQDFTYGCDTVAAGLPLGVQSVNVNAKVTVPDEVEPGEVIPTRKTQITLTLPETLRNATYGLLAARQAGGASEDAAITVTADGYSGEDSYTIQNLSAPFTPVPATAGDPWLIPTEGDVPAITVPADATPGGVTTIHMPGAFNITASLLNASGGYVGGEGAVTMACTLQGTDDVFGTVPIASEPTDPPTTEPTDPPTTEPTDPPTTEPTDPPTTEPTDPPTTEPTDPPTTDPTEPPAGSTVSLPISGTSELAKQDGTLDINGDLTGTLNLGPPVSLADGVLDIDQIEGHIRLLGIPGLGDTTSTINLIQTQPTTAVTDSEGYVTVDLAFKLGVPRVSSDLLPWINIVRSSCGTGEIQTTLRSTNTFSLDGTLNLVGEYTIPKFKNCDYLGARNALLTSLLSGSGNTLELEAGPIQSAG